MGMTLSMEEKVQTAAETVIHAPAADETVTGRIVHAEDFDPLFAMSEEDCVEGFIKREMQRAGISEEQNLIPEDMLRRKNILNAVLAVLLFVYISLFFFHFPMKTYVIGLIILVVYAFLTSRYQLIKYLKKIERCLDNVAVLDNPLTFPSKPDTIACPRLSTSALKTAIRLIPSADSASCSKVSPVL